MKRLLCLLLFALLLPLSGCFSYSTLHTATPVEKGKVEVNLAPGVFGIGDSASGSSVTLPTTEIAGRYGVTDDFDFGIKLFFLGTAFDFNYAIVNEEKVAFSVDPYISISQLSGTLANDTTTNLIYGVTSLNLLLDLKPSDMVTFTIGAKPGWLYALGNVNGDVDLGTGFAAGGMAGIELRVNENFAIMPSADVLVPIMDESSGLLYSGSVGFKFGF
ncbi:MAG: hypothetical protein ACQEVA_23505 [Myxococcota bacterium]